MSDDDHDYDRSPAAIFQRLSARAERRNDSLRAPTSLFRRLHAMDPNKFGGPPQVKAMTDTGLKILDIGDTSVDAAKNHLKAPAVKAILQSSATKKAASKAVIKLLKTTLDEWNANRYEYMPHRATSFSVPWQIPFLAGGLKAVATITEINQLVIDLMTILRQDEPGV